MSALPEDIFDIGCCIRAAESARSSPGPPERISQFKILGPISRIADGRREGISDWWTFGYETYVTATRASTYLGRSVYTSMAVTSGPSTSRIHQGDATLTLPARLAITRHPTQGQGKRIKRSLRFRRSTDADHLGRDEVFICPWNGRDIMVTFNFQVMMTRCSAAFQILERSSCLALSHPQFSQTGLLF